MRISSPSSGAQLKIRWVNRTNQVISFLFFPHPQDTTAPRPKQPKKSKAKQPRQPKQNTAIYVTGLPPDATVEEIQELFQRKCGVIAEEIDNNRPRIKLYTDEDGKFKGDALVVFFKPESVNMAITLLDDTEFRYSASGLTTGNMRIQAADKSYKKTIYNLEQDQTGGESSGSKTSGSVIAGGNGNHHSAEARSRAQDKAKVIKKTQKLEAKLADWDDDEPLISIPGLAPLPSFGKNARVVILKHMFTLEELKEDPGALLEIKEDIRDECSKLGTVTNVVLYDEEEDGIVKVNFKDADAAEKCILTMHGRMFDGRTVEAYLASGKVKFRKSTSHGNGNESDDSD